MMQILNSFLQLIVWAEESFQTSVECDRLGCVGVWVLNRVVVETLNRRLAVIFKNDILFGFSQYDNFK